MREDAYGLGVLKNLCVYDFGHIVFVITYFGDMCYPFNSSDAIA